MREQEEVGAVGRIIQRVEGEDVRAGHEEAAELGDIEVEEVRGGGVGARAKRGGVEGGDNGGIAAGDLLAVDVGNEAVLELHPQGEAAEVRGIGHGERHTRVE